jgi:APA family basic amino acid/polyamine antiporter
MPNVPRPYRTFGYPIVPALYIVAAAVIMVVLLIYRPATTWPGFVIVLLGIPVFALLRGRAPQQPSLR